MAELKPCPFCGCAIIDMHIDSGAAREYGIERYRARCEHCAAQMYRGTEKELVEAWNRRADNGN